MSTQGVACLVFLVFGLVVGSLLRTFVAWWRSIREDEAQEGLAVRGLPVQCCSGCWKGYTREEWSALVAYDTKEQGVDGRICLCGKVLEIDAADLADDRPYTEMRGV